MQDAFAYCADLVRTADRDRFLATLFAPPQLRPALHALYAFNVEVSRVRDVARQPLAGEIRLQWWSDVLRGERGGEASANPVANALLATAERHRLASTALLDLIEARRFDLYDDAMMTLADLEAYARKTSSALFAAAAKILVGTGMDAVAEPAGLAHAIAGLIRAFPLHTARRQLYVPVELLKRHQVQEHDLFAARTSSGLNDAFAELRDLGRRHLTTAHEDIAELPREALPAFLPVALVRPSLDRLDRCDAFAPVEILPWRRQWLIWRASRNPAWIAGS